MTRYISSKDTAALVRQALKESFPGVKFSVRKSDYSMGASVSVRWVDGPSVSAVERVTSVFEGSYFDGMTDYKGSVFSLLDGERVKFGADSVHVSREESPQLIEQAIEAVSARYAVTLRERGIERPSVEDFKRGALWRVQMFDNGGDNLDCMIRKVLHGLDAFGDAKPSTTLARVAVAGDDGYRRERQVFEAEPAQAKIESASTPVQETAPVQTAKIYYFPGVAAR